MFDLKEKLLEKIREKNNGWIPVTEGPDFGVRYGCTAGCGGNPCTSSCKGGCKNGCKNSKR